MDAVSGPSDIGPTRTDNVTVPGDSVGVVSLPDSVGGRPTPGPESSSGFRDFASQSRKGPGNRSNRETHGVRDREQGPVREEFAELVRLALGVDRADGVD